MTLPHPSMSSQCKPTPNNGRDNLLSTTKRHVLPSATEDDNSMVYHFSKEYMNVVALLKTRNPLEELMFW